MNIPTKIQRSLSPWLRLFAAVLVAFATLLAPQTASPGSAEGTRELLTNGGKRALTEFRNSKTAGLYRRTWLRVYAKAGETILMGSSGMDVGSGDIWLWKPNVIADSQMATASIPTPGFKCSSLNSKGYLNSRTKELAGPLPNAGGYDPCTYTAPEAGVYWIAMLGPQGLYGTSDGAAGTITSPTTSSSQNAGVSMWDITVRAGAATQSGRVFTDYLATLSGGNGNTYQQYSTLYASSADGFVYRIDLRGLDPNGYILYGNSVGFLDPDGRTPLYHDLVATENTLSTPLGGVKQSPATAKIWFSPPAADLPTTVIPTPQTPSILNVQFAGSAGGTAANYAAGGEFRYTGTVGGISEIVVSRDGSNFDPTLGANRVLRSVTVSGANVILWDGKDNTGSWFPVGGPYDFRASMHAGEYHFPMLDAENSLNGGPTLTLLNPIGGTCPYASCSTAFYDDRSYTTSTGVTVNPLTAAGGKKPPTTTYANPATGFNSASLQRAWGDGSGDGFGNWKGLDLWTYFPGAAIENELTVVAQAGQDARLQKTHSGLFVIGQNATYTLRVSNSGSALINGVVTVTDTLPVGLAYVSGTGTGWTCSAEGQDVTCTHQNTGNLAAGASLPNITLTVAVAQAAAPNVTNTAAVSIVSTDDNPANNTASDPTVIESADLAVVKTVEPATVTSAGQQATYTVVVTNNGPSAATGVELTEVIPAGLSYSSFLASQGVFSTATGEWVVGSMPAGSSATLAIVTTVDSITCGATIENTASRTASSPFDYEGVNDSASASLLLGGTVALNGVVSEAGNGAAIVGAAVQLTDSAAHVYNTTSGAGGAYSFISTQANPIALGTASLQVSKAGYQTSIQNNVSISTCGDNTQDVQLDTANLLVSKSNGQITAKADELLNYTITVLNMGTIPAQNVVLVDTLDRNLLIYLTDTSGLTPVTVNNVYPDTRTIRTYTLPDALDPNESFSFTFSVQVTSTLGAATAVWNRADASTTSPEADITNNEFTDTDPVATAPDLKISKSNGVTLVQAGQDLAYQLTYRNDGNTAASGVTVVDTLPANVTFGSCSPPTCGYASGPRTVTWSDLAAAVGEQGVLTVNVTVDSGATPGAVVLNQAAITDDGTHGADPNTSNNIAYDSDTVAAPNIVLEKSINSVAEPPNWGDQVTFTLSYANRGRVIAKNVVISDPLPANTTFVSASAGCAHDAGAVTCSLGDVAAGASGSVQVVATLAKHASSATQSAATLTSESSPGSVVVTTAMTDTIKAKWTDSDPNMDAGWNANPRAASFDETGWTEPIGSFIEGYWTDASRIDAKWIATTQDDQLYGNYTFYRQKFCVPLNAAGLSGSLEVANDDYGDQTINHVFLGTPIGAGTIAIYDATTAVQAGANLYAVRLLNNTHGGHSVYGFTDHVGLAARLTVHYSDLTPFVAAPAMALAGTQLTFAMQPTALGGVAPFQYQIDFGDGAMQTWSANTSFNHTYTAAGNYVAVVTARDAWGCTAVDQVSVTVLPAERNLLVNTATVAYENGYEVDFSSQASDGVPLLSLVDLSVTKTSAPQPVKAGEHITYTIRVANSGANSLDQVFISDTLPSAIVGPVYQVTEGSFDSASGFWTGVLGNGDWFDLTIEGMVDPVTPAGALNNTAAVEAVNGTDDISANNSATDANTVTRCADLAVAISSDPAQYTPSQPLTYTVVITNFGAGARIDFDLPLTLPPALQDVSYTPSEGTFDSEMDVWTDLLFGSVQELTLVISGTVPAGTSGILVAEATASADDDCDLSNNSDEVSISGPLGVALASFEVEQVSSHMVLAWETATELSNRGFNLWRGTSPAGPDRQLNATLIPSQSQGSPSGFSYTWQDASDLVFGVTYYYWLEDLNTLGILTRHEPVSVTYTTPLAVALASFAAQAQAGRVVVTWETVSERSNAGFNLYRSEDAAGPLTLLAALPSHAPGSTAGAAYSYEDLDVQPGQTYWYTLEDVSLSGATTLHGPVSATLQGPTAVRLAGLQAGSQSIIPVILLLAVALAGLVLATGQRRRPWLP